MSKTGVISASLRTEPHSVQADNSQPKPNDAFVELHDFVFGTGETLGSLKLHYLTLGTPRRDASGAIANGVLLLNGTAGSAADLAQTAFLRRALRCRGAARPWPLFSCDPGRYRRRGIKQTIGRIAGPFPSLRLQR